MAFESTERAAKVVYREMRVLGGRMEERVTKVRTHLDPMILIVRSFVRGGAICQ